MQNRHLVVIGASAGGIEALRELVARLPADFAAPIAVVLHTSPHAPGILHEILTRSGPLPAINPRSGERLKAGRIYVAPPDMHLLVEPGVLRLTRGPRENRFRPAIDPLFRSAAQVYGPGAIGVLLTGNLDDGTAGLWAIKRLGGTAIVQNPADALFPSMPEHALRSVNADHVAPLARIPGVLRDLMTAALPAGSTAAPRELGVEIRIAKEEDPMHAGIGDVGEPSAFSCPECHGVLLKIKKEGPIRFRCHTGHAYSAETLLAEIRESAEAAVWKAIRALHEGAFLLNELGAHSNTAHGSGSGERFTSGGETMRRQAERLRDLVMHSMECPPVTRDSTVDQAGFSGVAGDRP